MRVKIEYKPNVLKLLTLPITVLVIVLYVGAETWFWFKYGVSFAAVMEEQGKLDLLVWNLSKIWLAHLLIVPFFISLGHTVTDNYIIGYNEWLKKRTIYFSEIRKIRKTTFGLALKIYDIKGNKITVFRHTLSGSKYLNVREKLGLK